MSVPDEIFLRNAAFFCALILISTFLLYKGAQIRQVPKRCSGWTGSKKVFRFERLIGDVQIKLNMHDKDVRIRKFE